MISAFDTTVTLFNRIGEDENGSALFSKTVIDRVRVSSRLRSSGGADLDPKSTSCLYFSLSKSKARDKKTYVSPSEWKNCDKATSFTFTNAGDCIAIGENGENSPPEDSMLITEASFFDARLNRLRHIKVTCAL